MAIFIVEGKPGAGKSYHTLVNDILPALKSGRPVYTNMAGLNKQLIALAIDRPIIDIEINFVEHAADWHALFAYNCEDKEGANLVFKKKSIFIIDEAQMIWNSRDFKSTTKGFTDLLAYHRHFGLDFVFLTQDAKLLDVNVSRLCEGCFTIKNLAFLSSFMLKKQYVVQYKQRPRDPIVSTDRGSYDKKYFPLYQSMVASNPYAKKNVSAFGNVKAFVIVGAVGYAVFSLTAHGFSFQRGAKKHAANIGAKTSPAVAASVAFPQGEGVGLKDAIADRPLVPSKPLSPAESLIAGGSPEKTCVKVPQKGTWAITYQGKTERGWSTRYETVCY